MTAEDINMFWHGATLGPIHAACVRSFQRHGHTVIMHCYEKPHDLPEGVSVFDASKLMPFSDLIAERKTGSVSIGADRYRYRLIGAGLGIYADCDMFCVRPITNSEYIIGSQQANSVNNAFLKYPPDSPLAGALIRATQEVDFVPPWLNSKKRIGQEWRRKIGLGKHVGAQKWGVWGPKLLTYLVKELNLEHVVAPIDKYYPVHHCQASLFFDPELQLEDLITPRTEAVHLWHKEIGAATPLRGSPLHQILNC